MIFANWVSDLSSLTFLILGGLAFVLAMIFRKEVKALLGRLTDFQWKDARVRAEPPPSNPIPEHAAAGDESPEPEQKKDHSADGLPAESNADSGEDSEEAIRASMFRAFLSRDRTEGERRYMQLKAVVTDAEELKRDQARRLMALFSAGLDDSAIASLTALTADPEIGGFAERMIGLCLVNSGRAEEAAAAFKKSAEGAKSSNDRAIAVSLRADALTGTDRARLAEQELQEVIAETEDHDDKLRLWTALADVYEKTQRPALRAIALHKVAEEAGNSATKWFNAAYAWASAEAEGSGLLAIHCYETALSFDPDRNSALNNVGVEAAKMKLPIRAVDFYQSAIENGNTLAAANMAERYLNAGFTQDAQRVIDDALGAEGADSKVSRIAAAIQEERETQQGRLVEISAEGAKASSFLSSYGSARLRSFSRDLLGGTWELASGKDLSVNLSADELELVWKVNGKRSHRRFVGEVAGSTAMGKFEKQDQWPFSEDKIHWSSDGVGYVILQSDPVELRLLQMTTEGVEFLRALRTD